MFSFILPFFESVDSIDCVFFVWCCKISCSLKGQEFAEAYLLKYQRTEGKPWVKFKDRKGNEVLDEIRFSKMHWNRSSCILLLLLLSLCNLIGKRFWNSMYDQSEADQILRSVQTVFHMLNQLRAGWKRITGSVRKTRFNLMEWVEPSDDRKQLSHTAHPLALCSALYASVMFSRYAILLSYHN